MRVEHHQVRMRSDRREQARVGLTVVKGRLKNRRNYMAHLSSALLLVAKLQSTIIILTSRVRFDTL